MLDAHTPHIRTSPFLSTPRCPSSLPSPRRRAPRRRSGTHPLPSSPSTNTMIAVQKPPSMFSSPALRPTHSRHPSAPVVVRPSHTPGVLNISKAAQPFPRPQHVQAQPRASRASPKAKVQQRSPQPSPAQTASVEKPKPSTTSPAKADQPSPVGDKSSRGRKQSKQPKDARRRSVSGSNLPFSAHRLTVELPLATQGLFRFPLRCRRAATLLSPTISPADSDTHAAEGVPRFSS